MSWCPIYHLLQTSDSINWRFIYLHFYVQYTHLWFAYIQFGILRNKTCNQFCNWIHWSSWEYKNPLVDSKILLICDSFFPFELSDISSNAELWLSWIRSTAFVNAFSGVLNSWDMLANIICRHLFVALIFSRRLMLDTFTNTCRNELFTRLPLNFNRLHGEELWIGLTRITFVIDSAVCDFDWNLKQISCKAYYIYQKSNEFNSYALFSNEDFIFLYSN